jgi:flagellin
VVVGSQTFSVDYSVANSITNIDQAITNLASQINTAAAASGSLISNVTATAGNGTSTTATLRLVNDRNEALAFSVAVTNGANPAVGPFSSSVAGAYSNGSVNAKSASNLNAGEQVEVTVGGNTYLATANGTTITNIDQAIANIAGQITNISGVSVAAGSGTSNSATLELTNNNASSVAFSARVLTAGNNVINTFTKTLTGEQTGGTTVDAGVLAVAGDPTEASFTLSNATALINGDGFRLGIGGKNLDFVFDGTTTVANAASSIVNQINQAKITGVTATLGNNGSFTVTNATAASVAFTTSTASGGTAAGGLSLLNGFTVDPSGTGAEKDAALTARLADIESAIQASTDAAATFGSAQKRFDIQEEFVTNLIDSLKLGVGTLTDANIEEASARLQSLQVQQQLGIQALSIANQQPQAILALFR